MEKLYEIQLDNGTSITASCDNSLILCFGDPCIFRKDFYQDFGKVMREIPQENLQQSHSEKNSSLEDPGKKSGETPQILRIATPEEVLQFKESQTRYPAITQTAQQYIERLALPMKIVNVHSSFDNKMIVIQFSADGRIDFRELVK